MDNIQKILYKIATSSIESNFDFTIIEQNYDDFLYNIYIHRLKDPVLKWNNKLIINNEDWIYRSSLRQRQFNELKKIIQTFNEHNVEYLWIKGLAMRKYYPEDIPRQSVDYDMLIKDLDVFWKSAQLLFNLGYRFDSFPIFTWDKHIYGLVKFRKEIDSETNILIEMNIGGFLISERTWLIDRDLWNRSSCISYNGVDLRVPNDEMNMLILIAEAGGNFNNRIRDAVDFKFLCEKRNINWTSILEKVQKTFLNKDFVCLKNSWNYLEKTTFENTKKGLLSLLKWRLRRDLFHLLPNIFKKDKFILRLFFHYIKLIGEYFLKKDKFLTLIKKIDLVMSPRQNFNLGGPTNFIPLETSITGTWKWEYVEGLNLIRTPIGVFLASNFCIHEDEEIEMAIELAKCAFCKEHSCNEEI